MKKQRPYNNANSISLFVLNSSSVSGNIFDSKLHIPAKTLSHITERNANDMIQFILKYMYRHTDVKKRIVTHKSNHLWEMDL